MISYSHKQRDFVDLLLQRIRAAKVDVWIDREGVRAGEIWRQELTAALFQCEILVPVLSPAFLASPTCRLEVLLARSFGKRIVPLMVEECTKHLPQYPETKGLEDIFMMYFTDLRSVGLSISEDEAFERVVGSLSPDSARVTERSSGRHVYVAFVWSEAEFADGIAMALRGRGHSVWIATRDVPLGVRWFDEQVRALQSARAMVVVINERVADSALLRTELVLASARGLRILPVLADSVKGDENRIGDLRRAVRARDDTLALYDLQWFSSDPSWDAMVAMLDKTLGPSKE
jgi:hypothetical protein